HVVRSCHHLASLPDTMLSARVCDSGRAAPPVGRAHIRSSPVNVETFFINITSEQPERLFEFYRDTVGIPQEADFGPHSLNAAGVIIGIDGHSETRGPAAEPHRYLLDFTVNGFDAFEARL